MSTHKYRGNLVTTGGGRVGELEESRKRRIKKRVNMWENSNKCSSYKTILKITMTMITFNLENFKKLQGQVKYILIVAYKLELKHFGLNMFTC